jgi:hypothetical protein
MSRIDPVNSRRGPGLWTVDLFHAFFYRKIIRLNQKIPGAPVFLQKISQTFPKLYFSPCIFTFRSLINFLNYD